MNRKVVISWVVVILWMVLIFTFSGQPAKESDELSLGVTAMILKFIENFAVATGVNANWAAEMNHIVRKSAHALVFFVLAMLAVNAFLKTGFKGIKAFVFAFMLTALYACTDEIHQMFVQGRACMLSDVGIDCMGGIVGLCMFGLGHWTFRRGIA